MIFRNVKKDTQKNSIESMQTRGFAMLLLGISTMLLSTCLDNFNFLSDIVRVVSIILNLCAIVYLANYYKLQKKG